MNNQMPYLLLCLLKSIYFIILSCKLTDQVIHYHYKLFLFFQHD